VEFGLDLTMLTPDHYKSTPARRLLVIELPPVRLREPVPLLAEMKVERGTRGYGNPCWTPMPCAACRRRR